VASGLEGVDELHGIRFSVPIDAHDSPLSTCVDAERLCPTLVAAEVPDPGK
jgi:hypothetical protein